MIRPIEAYDPSTGRHAPFFPFGWYTWGPIEDLATLQAIKDSGANTVLFVDLGADEHDHRGYQNKTRQGLDLAQALGLKVVLGLHRNLIKPVDPSVPASYAALASWVNGVWENGAWVNRFVDHPAVLGWVLGDELNREPTLIPNPAYLEWLLCIIGEGLRVPDDESPCGPPPPQKLSIPPDPTATEVQNTAALVRAWDPNRQIWQVSLAGVSDTTTAEFWIGTDVYAADYYNLFDSDDLLKALPTPEFGGVPGLMDFYTKNGIRGSTYGWAGNVTVTQGLGPDLGGERRFRFPTPAEYRWNVFAALASAGSRGILNWIYWPEVNSNPNALPTFLENTVRPVGAELRKLQHGMETGWNVGAVSVGGFVPPIPPVLGTFPYTYASVSTLLVYDDIARTYYLVVTNNGGTALGSFAVTLSSLPVPLRNTVARISGSSTILPLLYLGGGAWRLIDSLPAFGVKIYEIADGAFGVTNGTAAGPSGWVPAGNAQYLSNLSRTADGSGALRVWASSWGDTGSSWSQTVRVTRNVRHAFRFYVGTGGWPSYYAYTIKDQNGTVLASANPVATGGGWNRTVVSFDPGESDTVMISLQSHSTDYVLFDDLSVFAAENGGVDTTRGWTASGANTSVVSGWSRTADGSDSVRVWADFWGADSASWSTCGAVTPGVEYVWSWFARAGASAGYYTWRVRDDAGTILATMGPVAVSGGSWQPFSARVNPGTNGVLCLELVSFSTDWVAFDEATLAPETIANGNFRTLTGWTRYGAYGDRIADSHTADGSGSVRVWAPTWADRGTQWSQRVAVPPNTPGLLTFWARPAAAEAYFGVQVRGVDGTLLAAASPVRALGGWRRYELPFSPGANAVVEIVLHSYSVDWVAFDDVRIFPRGLVNGTIATSRGWTGSGTVDVIPSLSHTADGSGSLKLWATTQGAATGQWSQCIAVAPGVAHTLRLYTKSGGNYDTWFTWRVRDDQGDVVTSGGTLIATGEWTPYDLKVNPGARSVVCIEFVSSSVDWQAIDDLSLCSP